MPASPWRCFEGVGSIAEESEGVFRLVQGNREYFVLCGDREAVANKSRISAKGRLAVIEQIEARPGRVWVVEAMRLTIDEREIVAEDQPVSKEIADEK